MLNAVKDYVKGKFSSVTVVESSDTIFIAQCPFNGTDIDVAVNIVIGEIMVGCAQSNPSDEIKSLMKEVGNTIAELVSPIFGNNPVPQPEEFTIAAHDNTTLH